MKRYYQLINIFFMAIETTGCKVPTFLHDPQADLRLLMKLLKN